jgi:hypothetical protein
MRLLVDIDSALVVIGPRRRRHSNAPAIARLKAMLKAGDAVTLCSVQGVRYARRFARDNGLEVCRVTAKPDAVVTRL